MQVGGLTIAVIIVVHNYCTCSVSLSRSVKRCVRVGLLACGFQVVQTRENRGIMYTYTIPIERHSTGHVAAGLIEHQQHRKRHRHHHHHNRHHHSHQRHRANDDEDRTQSDQVIIQSRLVSLP